MSWMILPRFLWKSVLARFCKLSKASWGMSLSHWSLPGRIWKIRLSIWTRYRKFKILTLALFADGPEVGVRVHPGLEALVELQALCGCRNWKGKKVEKLLARSRWQLHNYDESWRLSNGQKSPLIHWTRISSTKASPKDWANSLKTFEQTWNPCTGYLR